MHLELARAAQSFTEIPCLVLRLLQQNRDLQGQLQPLWGWAPYLGPHSLGRCMAGGHLSSANIWDHNDPPPETGYAFTG